MFGLDNVMGGMGNLLGGAGGGSSGGILGTVGGIVGGVFGGPIGSMIGSAVGNMLQDSVGDGMKQATHQLQQEHGMPSFLADLVNKKVDEVMGSLKNNNVDPSTARHCQDKFGDAFRDFAKQLADQIVKDVRDQMQQHGAGEGCEGKGGKGGKSSGGSWMQAIAESMGKVMGQKASDMVKLSKKIADETAPAGDDKQSEGSKAEVAAQTQTDNTKFQATSQEFNLLQTTFSTAIKTLGEGMKQIASKQ